MYKEKTDGNGQVKIGVYICHCGVNISDKNNVTKKICYLESNKYRGLLK